jgi:predicted TIM-barrel fold metal-dependent hydrolase
MRPNVHIEVSGVPPKKLPDYYSNFDFDRLARKMIFGTDWPGVPGPKANAEAIFGLGLERDTLAKVLHQNATRIYKLERTADPATGSHGAGSS